MDFNTTGGSGTPPRSPSVAAGRSPGREFDSSDPVRSFVNTVWRVLFSPKDFFRGMPPRGGFTNPLIFAVVCALITALFSGVVNEIMLAVPAMRGLAYDISFRVVAVTTFFFMLFWLALVTAGNHLFVRLIVGRNNGGFEATFRVLSYARVVQVVSALPLLNLVAWIYGLYLCAFGFREVHSTTYGKAAAIVALPILLFILVIILFTFGAVFLLAT
jgi:hypothetical protein